MFLATRQNWMLVLYILVANALDAIITHDVVKRGIAEELNPFMDTLLRMGPSYFFGIKISMVTLAALALMRFSSHVSAQRALILGAFVYTLILCIHFVGLCCQKL